MTIFPHLVANYLFLLGLLLKSQASQLSKTGWRLQESGSLPG